MDNISKINNLIDDLQKELKTSGYVYISKGSSNNKSTNALADKLTIEKYLGDSVNKDSKVLFKSHTSLFVKLVLLDIINKDETILYEHINKYFPNIDSDISIKLSDLITGNTPFTNYMFSRNLETGMSDEEFFISEQIRSINPLLENDLIDYINKNSYKDKFITHDNHTNSLLGVYLVEKITGQNFLDYLNDYLCENINVEIDKGLDSNIEWFGSYRRDIRYKIDLYGNNIINEYIFSMKVEDYLKLVKYLYEDVFKSEVWKKYCFIDKEIIYENNGLYCIDLNFMSCIENRIAYNYDENLLVVTMYNDKGYGKFFNGFYEGMTCFIDRAIKMFTVYCDMPKLVEANGELIISLMKLEISDNQKDYISESRNLLCMALAKNYKIYALVDKNESVGFVTLTIDKLNKNYFINSVMIDKRFQGRGYGRVLIENTLKLFKENNADKVGISVRKENLVAYNLYTKCGFKVIDQNLQTYVLEKDMISDEI